MSTKKPQQERTPAAILNELSEIEVYFQTSDLDLDEAISKHARAVKLAKELEVLLKKSEDVFERISAGELQGQEEAEEA